MNSNCFSGKILFPMLFILGAFSLLVISVPATAAATFDVEYTPVTTRTYPGGFAEYEVTIHNYMDREKIFSISPELGDSANWIFRPNSIRVGAGQERTFMLTLLPRFDLAPGSYGVGVRIRMLEGELKVVRLPVSVSTDVTPLGFLPSVSTSVSMADEHDPRNPLRIGVVMANRNPLNITNMVIRAQSDLFYEEFETSLIPFQEKTDYLSISINPLQAPGEYNLRISLFYPPIERVVAEVNTELVVARYSSIERDYDVEKSWFLKTETIVIENWGNAEETVEEYVRAPWYNRIFMKAEPEPELVKVDGTSNYMFSFSLEPAESVQVTVTTNHRPLAIAILIIVVAIVLYYVLRSPIIIVKEAEVVSEDDDDSMSEIKVRIFVKNRSGKSIHKLSVTDKLPGITELAEPTYLGSLKPTKVTKTSKKGTILYWDLDTLDSFEERILTYRAKSKLKVIGDLSLPRARVKFESLSGSERVVVSGTPSIIRY